MATGRSFRPSRSRESTASADSPKLSILILLARDGLLRGFTARGHAGEGVKGENVACAAATILLRTTGRLCTQHGVAAAGGRGDPGEMALEVAQDSADQGWLRGVTDFLLRGMKDLKDEFPREIVLQVKMMED